MMIFMSDNATHKAYERARKVALGLKRIEEWVPAHLAERARQLIREFLRSENEKDTPK
jgi:hypothetical protein